MLKSLIQRLTHRHVVVATPMGGLPVEVLYKSAPPERTRKMISDGFVWTECGDGWTEVCLTCGGNCGQCGTSLGQGNPVKMNNLIKVTGMNNPVAGLRRF